MEGKYPKHIFLKPIVCKRTAFSVNGPSLIKILSCIMEYEFKDTDYLKCALEELNRMSCSDSPHYQFLYAQLQWLLTSPKGRLFDKNLYVLAAELHTISPAACRMLWKSGSIVLPREELLKKLLSNSLDDENLKQLFQKLQPQQCLVNMLFDEMKLTETLRCSGGRVVGNAQNGSGDGEVLATHALVIEVVCHFGGPKYILHIYPVAKLNSDQLKEILLAAVIAVSNVGGIIISCVCDNCNTNVAIYGKLCSPGKIFIDAINSYAFLVYVYVHSSRNISNNWFTVDNKELSFTKDGKTYAARWRDIENIYNEDWKNSIRLTMITYTVVYPEPLQRRSVPFVCQMFNDKTDAALPTLKDKLGISEGAIIFVKLITDWFHMMNGKIGIPALTCVMNVVNRGPSIALVSRNFLYPLVHGQGGKGRTQKLTKQTAKAFVLSTRSNIQAAELLLTQFRLGSTRRVCWWVPWKVFWQSQTKISALIL